MQSTDRYLEYIINKWFVFDKRSELHEANTIVDIDIIKRYVTIPKRVSDQNMIVLTQHILETFMCFPITITIRITDRVPVTESETIYMHYKRYKNSTSSTQATETTLQPNTNLDTSKTVYVDSLDNVTTKQLQALFGDPLLTGNPGDNYRYEYRLEFITDHKRHIFSLYDYLNTRNTFNDLENVYWHIASETTNPKTIRCFVDYLHSQIDVHPNASHVCHNTSNCESEITSDCC